MYKLMKVPGKTYALNRKNNEMRSDLTCTTDTDCALSETGTKWLFEQHDHCAVDGTLSCQ